MIFFCKKWKDKVNALHVFQQLWSKSTASHVFSNGGRWNCKKLPSTSNQLFSKTTMSAQRSKYKTHRRIHYSLSWFAFKLKRFQKFLPFADGSVTLLVDLITIISFSRLHKFFLKTEIHSHVTVIFELSQIWATSFHSEFSKNLNIDLLKF